MQKFPERLISNEHKVRLINENYCDGCTLNRRTALESLHTPAGVIDPNIWNSSHIFGLSMNIFLCNSTEIGVESKQTDVNITPIDVEEEDFLSDSQLEKYDFDSIMCQIESTLIISMRLKEIKEIEGTYPFKKGSPDEVVYNYKLYVEHHPTVLNAFHFQIEVFTDENEAREFTRINSNDNKFTKKKYIRSLATSIRNRMIHNDIIKAFPSLN